MKEDLFWGSDLNDFEFEPPLAISKIDQSLELVIP